MNFCNKIVNKYYESPYVNKMYKCYFQVGIQTFPTLGRIFVFPTLRDAMIWMDGDARCMNHKLLFCECDTIVRHVRNNVIDRYDIYEEYWKDPDNKGVQLTKRDRVFSTNWVRPIREIEIGWFCEYLQYYESVINGTEVRFTDVHNKR